jgi:GNAT superfamily N-acetyltransferase
MAPFKKLPDLAALEFVYASYSENMAGASATSYIRPIHGTIEHERFREVIGRFHLSYVDIGLMMDEGRSLGCVMDGASLELGDIYAALYDPDTCCNLREDAADIVGWFTFNNLLVINLIEVLPAHRGMGLGLAALWHLIRRHSTGCGVVAAIASPLQFRDKPKRWQKDDYEKQMDYESFKGGMDEARGKLISFYEKLGFKPIGTDGIVAMSTGMTHELPDEIRGWVPDPRATR